MYLVYVAGKFRGSTRDGVYDFYEQEENVRTAERLAHKVWLIGPGRAVGVCPHSMTRYWQGSAPDEVWLDGDIALMKRCDVVLLVPNWRESEGARKEKAVAEEAGIPVLDNLEDLEAWMDYQDELNDEESIDALVRALFSPQAKQEVKTGDSLTRALTLITKDRNKSYGDAYEDFTRIANIFNAARKKDLTAEDVAVFFICGKLSRECNEHKDDNCDDGAGYFDLLNYVHHKSKQDAGRPAVEDAGSTNSYSTQGCVGVAN